MKGLILKDILTLKAYGKQYLFMIGFFTIFGILGRNMQYVCFMTMMFGCMTIFTTMTYDERSNFNKLAISMPLSRMELVLSKYISWLMATLGCVILALLVGGGMTIYFKQSVLECIISIVAVTTVYLVAFSIMIPLIYKLGVEKGRVLLMAILLVPTLLIILGGMALEKLRIPMPSAESVQKLIWLLPVVAVVFVIGSFYTSVKVVEKKEW